MGFSWSSFIAQTVLLTRCVEAGLPLRQILSDHNPPPDDMSETYALATDDLMLFSVRSSSTTPAGTFHGQERCKQFDRILRSHGIQASPEKDINGSMSDTCIGIDICDGMFFAPNAAKLAKLCSAVCYLMESRSFISPLECAAVLGSCTWFALLNRPSFSTFDRIYAFTQGYSNVRVELPANVLGEIVAFIALAPLLEVDLTRGWLERLVATDASGSYGFGVSTTLADEKLVRRLGHAAERPGQFVRLEREDPSIDPEKPRKGTMLSIPLSKSAFRTVVMARAAHKAHSGSLESCGVALGLRWLLRSPKHHSKRVVFLVDAQAVLSAVNKGRSSAPSIEREIAHISALCLAGD